MKTAEAWVVQKPVDVTLNCPHCRTENTRTYSDFCDEFGEPCDWNFSVTKCKSCKKEFEIFGSDW